MKLLHLVVALLPLTACSEGSAQEVEPPALLDPFSLDLSGAWSLTVTTAGECDSFPAGTYEIVLTNRTLPSAPIVTYDVLSTNLDLESKTGQVSSLVLFQIPSGTQEASDPTWNGLTFFGVGYEPNGDRSFELSDSEFQVIQVDGERFEFLQAVPLSSSGDVVVPTPFSSTFIDGLDEDALQDVCTGAVHLVGEKIGDVAFPASESESTAVRRGYWMEVPETGPVRLEPLYVRVR